MTSKKYFQTSVFWWGNDGREFAGPWLHVTLATLFFFAHPVYKSLKECKYLKRGKEEPNSAKELVNHFSYSSNCFKKTRMNKYQNIENTVKTLRELGYVIVNHYRGSGLGWLLQDFDWNHAVKIMIFSFLVDFSRDRSLR